MPVGHAVLIVGDGRWFTFSSNILRLCCANPAVGAKWLVNLQVAFARRVDEREDMAVAFVAKRVQTLLVLGLHLFFWRKLPRTLPVLPRR